MCRRDTIVGNPHERVPIVANRSALPIRCCRPAGNVCGLETVSTRSFSWLGRGDRFRRQADQCGFRSGVTHRVTCSQPRQRQGEHAMRADKAPRDPRKRCHNCGLPCNGLFCSEWCIDTYLARRDAHQVARRRPARSQPNERTAREAGDSAAASLRRSCDSG